MSILIGCEDYFIKDKYKRPDWLPGKLYTTVKAQENLSMFAECLQRAGLDTIIDVSGSWSVFAPDNEAIVQYLSENHYASIADIPIDELERMAEFHVIQNPWSLEQLQILASYGWRTGEDNNWRSYAYKRQTMLKNPVEKYWTRRKGGKEMIVLDSTIANSYKKVFVASRKYVPIFYDAYFRVNGISYSDYSFYFDRDYEPGNVYYAGAKIIQADIIAENGFVHVIDRVVNPMLNAKELLNREIPGESYKFFLEMAYWYYPSFDANMTATENQPEIRMGGQADTLWDLNYNGLAFDLQKENIGYEGSGTNETLVRHNGFFAPTDDPFKKFIDGTLTANSGYPHWHDYKSLPIDVVDFIISQNIKSSPIFPSTTQYKGVFMSNGRFYQKEDDIIRKEFGSNCTFIGINSYIPDKVFTSVTGPVFCRPNYSLFRRAMEYSGAYDAIANNSNELYFFPIPDFALMADSSLIINWINEDENQYNFKVFNRYTRQIENIGSSTLRNWILNQVGVSVSYGADNKETIRTLRGNTITWNHSDNTIQGTRPSTFGYNGEIVEQNYPVPLEEPADNGKVWSVGHWFNF